MAGIIFTSGKFQAIGQDGAVVPYGKLFFTYCCSGEEAITYQDSQLTIPNVSPLILSASGKADVFLKAEKYNVVLKDKDDQVVWSIDNFDPTGLDTISVFDRQALIDTTGRYNGEMIYQSDIDLTYTWKDSGVVDNGGTEIGNGAGWVHVPAGNINVKWFGAVGDGSNDDTESFKKAVLYCNTKRKNLYIPNGNFILKGTAVNENILGEIHFSIVGESKEYSSIYFQEKYEDSGVSGFRIYDENITISDVFMRIDSTSQGSYIASIDTGDGVTIKNCRFEAFGTGGASNTYQASLFKISNIGNSSNVRIDSNEFKNFKNAFFSSIDPNISFMIEAIKENWIVTNNHFSKIIGDVFNLNGRGFSFGNISIQNNEFYTKINTTDSTVIKFTGCSDIDISNNNFRDIKGDTDNRSSAIFLDNVSGTNSINNNKFDGCYRAIGLNAGSNTTNTKICSNTLDGTNNHDTTDKVKLFTQSYKYSIGIDIDSSTSDGVFIQNNSISNFDKGVAVSNITKLCNVSNNIISLCYAAIEIKGYFNTQISDNVINNCKFLYRLLASGVPVDAMGNLGHTKAYNCYRIFCDTGADFIYCSIRDFEWVIDNFQAVDLPDVYKLGQETKVGLFEAPKKMDGKFNVFSAVNMSRASNYSHASGDLILVNTISLTSTFVTKTGTLSFIDIIEISDNMFKIGFESTSTADEAICISFLYDGLIIF